MHPTKLTAAVSFSFALACAWISPDVLRAEDSGDAKAPQRAEPYADWLLGSYLAAPLLATGVAFGLAGLQRDEVTPGDVIVGAAIGLLFPAAMHVLHGEIGLGLRAYFLWSLIAVGSGAIGGLIGATGYALSSKSSRAADLDDGFAGLDVIAIGTLAGLIIGTVAWPIFDINDAYHRDEHRHGPPRLTFGVVPTVQGRMLGVMHASFLSPAANGDGLSNWA